jgi:hypothetical protein
MEKAANALTSPHRNGASVAAGFGMLVGLGAVVAAFRLWPTESRPARRDEKLRSLSSYLREHLAGADAAVEIVERLRGTHAGTEDGHLFAYLFAELQEDRAILEKVLTNLEISPRSAKRVVGHASGALTRLTAGGEPGDLSLFRTLEGLSIGVQGKRCMWRALQALGSDLGLTSGRLTELESKAVHQWEAIEERRRVLAVKTFPEYLASAHA